MDTLSIFVEQLPFADYVNFSSPTGPIQISSPNMDVDKFYYQCRIDLESDFIHVYWKIVKLKESSSPNKINTECCQIFNEDDGLAAFVGWGIYDGCGNSQLGVLSEHLATEVISPNSVIPDVTTGTFYKYYVPDSA